MNIDNARQEQHFHLFTQGDQRGLNYIYEKQYRSIFLFASRILQNEHAVNMIINDAFISAWDRRLSMKSYLHIVRSVRMFSRWKCLTYLKSKAGKVAREMSSSDFLENTTAMSTDPFSEMELRDGELVEDEQWQLFQKAMSYLPEGRREILALHTRGLHDKDIADVVGKPPQYIAREIKSSVNLLHIIIERLVKAGKAYNNRPHILGSGNEVYLTSQQLTIYKLYCVKKYSIARIAAELNLTTFQVIKQLKIGGGR